MPRLIVGNAEGLVVVGLRLIDAGSFELSAPSAYSQ
jgi:hypothetical protein